jgi:nitroreductase
VSRETVLKIIDLARWAPSGDNTQPWRFEIVDDAHLAIHGYDTRRDVVYDFDGHASHLAHGALLETLRLAATRFGLAAAWTIRPGRSDDAPIYDVALSTSSAPEDPLVGFIETRCVQRRAMRTTPLSPHQKTALGAAVGDDYSLALFEGFGRRLAVARLLWDSAYLRLTCPEAYPVHRDIIEWNARFSNDRIPDQAVGVDPLTARLMKWVMQSWQRVDFFNRYLLGTVAPRVQLDFIPALACAAHLLLRPKRPLAALPDYLRAGAALQRLWLTAAALGLQLQPQMTPLIFRWYARAGRPISALPAIDDAARALASRIEALAGVGPDDSLAFFCRVGAGPAPRSRSLRKPLDQLLLVAPRQADERRHQGQAPASQL